MRARYAGLGLPKKQLLLVYTPSRGFSHCIGYHDFSQKKIRSLAQFFRSAQLTLIFWLFDVLLLYECCQNMHQNPCFWENCLYRAKNMFYPKTKVVPETLRNSWFHDKKFFTKKNYFGGIHGVPKMAKTPKITLFINP